MRLPYRRNMAVRPQIAGLVSCACLMLLSLQVSSIISSATQVSTPLTASSNLSQGGLQQQPVRSNHDNHEHASFALSWVSRARGGSRKVRQSLHVGRQAFAEDAVFEEFCLFLRRNYCKAAACAAQYHTHTWNIYRTVLYIRVQCRPPYSTSRYARCPIRFFFFITHPCLDYGRPRRTAYIHCFTAAIKISVVWGCNDSSSPFECTEVHTGRQDSRSAGVRVALAGG